MTQTRPVPTRRARLGAYAVHLYTATGLLLGLLTAAAIIDGRYRLAFGWLIVAVLIDATDGFLAHRFHVRETLPHVDGRKIDDIVDYLNYTFLPMLLIWRAGWFPEPGWLWASVPLVASVFAFTHIGAKEDDEGFFRGFPSYWNIFAFYTAVWLHPSFGPYGVLGVALGLSVLSVLPVRFLYPNRAPRWRGLLLAGGGIWLLVILAMLTQYPDRQVPTWVVGISLIYPTAYAVLSIHLDRASRDAAAQQ
jgi:phosphatidylcholine synthase